ncbi:unnamed protein product [Gordionus sp. m RMFG-2023]|uniref:aldo-keto reductase IolS-like n=1 Tax=Gordionus sp. m RMFG-2023 TaxID=3053472 RepID=UPI0030E02A91
MKLVHLKNSDLKVSPICLGTWQFNGNTAGTSMGTWNAQDINVSKKIVDAAIESGINFFDTAEAYLNSEKVLGDILDGSYKSRRSDLVIASKFGFNATPGSNKPVSYTPADIEDSLNQSLRSLKTDYLDLYQVHWPEVMNNVEETVKELKRLQSLGKIRYYGVSNFGPQTLKEFYDFGGEPVSNQLPYSLLWRSIEYEIIPECAKRNLSILAYSPLAQGLLSGKYNDSTSFPNGRRRIRLFNCKSTPLAVHTESGCEDQVFKALGDIKQLLTQLNVCKKSGLDIQDDGDGKEQYGMVNLSLDWILSNLNVGSVIVGASSADQITQICKNASSSLMNTEMKRKLDEITEPIKEAIGNNPDMWFTKSRYK